MDVEKAIEMVGGFGCFQVQMCVLNFFKDVLCAFHMIGMVFIALVPESVNCDKKEIIHSSYYTIVNEWDLICEQAFWVDVAQSFFMAGVLFGALSFGPLSDIYGRRRVLFVTFFLQNVLAFMTSFAHSFPLFVTLRGVLGFFSQGCGLSSFTLLMEIVGAPHRGAVGILSPICFAVGIILLGGFALLFHSWHQLTLAMGLAGFALMPFYGLVLESPRWLVNRGRLSEAEAVLRQIAKRNGRAPDVVAAALEMVQTEKVPQKAADFQESLLSVFRHPRLRTWTFVILVSWAVNSALYYGLTFISGKFGGSPHLSVAVSGLMEIPSYILTPWLMRRFGRRGSLIGFMFSAGFCCICIVLLPAGSTISMITLATFGKLFISGSFAIAYVHTLEVYPTSVRTGALGLASMSARLGGIVAPFILILGGSGNRMAFAIFSALAFASGTFNLKLPETSQKPMLQVIADLPCDNRDVDKPAASGAEAVKTC